MSFIVRYPGAACDDCGEEILVGQEATYRTDQGDLAHAGPCPVIRPEGAARPVCGSCRLELPVSGVCGECS